MLSVTGPGEQETRQFREELDLERVTDHHVY